MTTTNPVSSSVGIYHTDTTINLSALFFTQEITTNDILTLSKTSDPIPVAAEDLFRQFSESGNGLPTISSLQTTSGIWPAATATVTAPISNLARFDTDNSILKEIVRCVKDGKFFWAFRQVDENFTAEEARPLKHEIVSLGLQSLREKPDADRMRNLLTQMLDNGFQSNDACCEEVLKLLVHTQVSQGLFSLAFRDAEKYGKGSRTPSQMIAEAFRQVPEDRRYNLLTAALNQSKTVTIDQVSFPVAYVEELKEIAAPQLTAAKAG